MAATHWAACDELVNKKHLINPDRLPMNFKVFVMDSTFLHARSLYEFFTATNTRNTDRLSWKSFGLVSGLISAKYSAKFIDDLHGRSMHLNKARSSYNPIKDEVVNVANDVLDLWDKFSNDPSLGSIYVAEMAAARSKSIGEADKVAYSYQQELFRPIFS